MHRWILIGLLACAACAGKKKTAVDATSQVAQFRGLIWTMVKDPDRRARAIEEFDAFEVTVKKYFDELRGLQTEAQKLNMDYDAPRASFEEIRVRARTARRRGAEDAIDHALAIRRIVTQEEWREINAAIRSEEDG